MGALSALQLWSYHFGVGHWSPGAADCLVAQLDAEDTTPVRVLLSNEKREVGSEKFWGVAEQSDFFGGRNSFPHSRAVEVIFIF